jgi:hypothetical protein
MDRELLLVTVGGRDDDLGARLQDSGQFRVHNPRIIHVLVNIDRDNPIER